MQALVVSVETLSGAQEINKYRLEHGLKPLRLVIVPVLGASAPGGKLSSTALRESDSQLHPRCF